MCAHKMRVCEEREAYLNRHEFCRLEYIVKERAALANDGERVGKSTCVSVDSRCVGRDILVQYSDKFMQGIVNFHCLASFSKTLHCTRLF